MPGENGVPFCCASHSPEPLLVPPAMGWNDEVARPRPTSPAQMLHENGGGGIVQQKLPCLWRWSLTKYPCFPQAPDPHLCIAWQFLKGHTLLSPFYTGEAKLRRDT